MAKVEQVNSQEGKFPNLNGYETLAKQKYLRNILCLAKYLQLVFALSGIDDYTNYLRSPAIDQTMGEKVKLRQMAGDENFFVCFG